VNRGRRRRLGLGAVAALVLLAGCARDREETTQIAALPSAAILRPAAPRPVPHFTGNAFIAADGARLPLRKWLPEGRVKAVVLALHGFNDYSHAFAGPGAEWAKRGIATYAYDQRGFGRAPERGRWPGSAQLAADATQASWILRRLYPGVPLYLLGESMGGAVATVAMTGAEGLPKPDVDGVVLAAPAVWGRAVMPLMPRFLLWAAVRLVPGMTVTGRGLKIVPSDNIAMLRELARDPLVIKQTRIDTIWGLVNLMDRAFAAAPRLDEPLLLLYGAHDQIIPDRAMRRFVAMLPRAPKATRRLAFYRDGYHMLLRDLEAARVVDDVANWILVPRAAPSSGADRPAPSPWG
jgi:alpha-beta hydrolase superfamily lysophospholipase